MTDLKTLKDLEDIECPQCNWDLYGYSSAKMLRKEAIKWIKTLRDKYEADGFRDYDYKLKVES